VFHFKIADPAFQLFAFMMRVRAETLECGTRNGILRGLSVTVGVITSAGVVLAATFAVPGVLLDTILVRRSSCRR